MWQLVCCGAVVDAKLILDFMDAAGQHKSTTTQAQQCVLSKHTQADRSVSSTMVSSLHHAATPTWICTHHAHLRLILLLLQVATATVLLVL